VRDLRITWAGDLATVTFTPVATTELRITMTSPTPGTARGFLRVSALSAR
jgi:hypothetical protein